MNLGKASLSETSLNGPTYTAFVYTWLMGLSNPVTTCYHSSGGNTHVLHPDPMIDVGKAGQRAPHLPIPWNEFSTRLYQIYIIVFL